MQDELPEELLLQAFEEADTSGMSDLAAGLEGDRFISRKLSGEGGSKLIYEVTDVVTGRKLALACPRGESEDAYELLLREARLHSILEHPNIIRLYDMGIESGRPYFTMKYVDGMTLEDYVLKKPPSSKLTAEEINQRLDIFLDICDALSYAHAKGVCHLDLKPSNIFMSGYNEVLVGDWGLARIAGQEEKAFELPLEKDYGQFTIHGHISGTPGYMAPEQCTKGVPKGPSSDIYALGALLVFLFCQKPPVAGDSKTMVAATFRGDLDFDYEKLPDSIEHVALKALKNKAADRYRSVADLRQDIQNFRLGFMTSVEPGSFAKQLLYLIKRNRLLSAVVGLFVVALSVMTTIYVDSIRDSEFQVRSALYDLQRSQQEKALLNEQRSTDSYKRALEAYNDKSLGVDNFNISEINLAYVAIEHCLDLNPNLDEAWLLKGKLALLQGNYADAVDSFKLIGQGAYTQAALKIISLEEKSNVKILSILRSLQDKRLVDLFIFKTTFGSGTLPQRAVFAKVALEYLNGLEDIHFEYVHDERKLDISGNKGLRNLYPVRLMRIKILDISHCPDIDTFQYFTLFPLRRIYASHSSLSNRRFRYFENKVVTHLDISHCKVTRLSPTFDMPLQEINVSGLPAEGIKVMRPIRHGTKVICSPAEVEMIRKINAENAKNWQIIVRD